MTTVLWVLPSAIAVLFLTIVGRRLILRSVSMPHGLTSVLAVLASTAVLVTGALTLIQGELGAAIALSNVLAGLAVGVFLSAQEFKRPHNG